MISMHSASRVPLDEPLRRLSVDEYEAMVAAGVFGPEHRLELLEGYLVEKMTKSPAHSAATRLTRLALTQVIPSGFYVDTQEPIATLDSEPEPDVSVIRGGPRDYLDRHPAASDVCLVVEVADTSLRRDRETKQRVYARAGIPTYWIVDLVAREIHVCERPGEAGYGTVTTLTESEEIPVVLDGQRVGVVRTSDLLP